MTTNMGKLDRAIRAAIGVALIAAFAFDLMTGVLAIIGLVVGLALVATAVFAYCPPYALLGVSTCARRGDAGS